MSKKIKYIAQSVQDDVEGNYAAGTSFFTLNDYIIRISHVASDYYRQGWKQMYDEARVEKREEIVSFDPTVLSEQVVKMKKENGEWVGEIKFPAMSLPWDQQTSGYQIVRDSKTGVELERSNINETWQYQYQPLNNRLFYRIEKQKIKVFTKGECNVQSVIILYVPSIAIGDGEAELPDGIIGYCAANTAAYIRANMDKKIIKKSLDGNQDLILETEMNRGALK